MAYIRQIEERKAAGAIRSVDEAAIARVGSVANIIKVMSLDSRSLQASKLHQSDCGWAGRGSRVVDGAYGGAVASSQE